MIGYWIPSRLICKRTFPTSPPRTFEKCFRVLADSSMLLHISSLRKTMRQGPGHHCLWDEGFHADQRWKDWRMTGGMGILRLKDSGLSRNAVCSPHEVIGISNVEFVAQVPETLKALLRFPCNHRMWLLFWRLRIRKDRNSILAFFWFRVLWCCRREWFSVRKRIYFVKSVHGGLPRKH